MFGVRLLGNNVHLGKYHLISNFLILVNVIKWHELWHAKPFVSPQITNPNTSYKTQPPFTTLPP